MSAKLDFSDGKALGLKNLQGECVENWWIKIKEGTRCRLKERVPAKGGSLGKRKSRGKKDGQRQKKGFLDAGVEGRVLTGKNSEHWDEENGSIKRLAPNHRVHGMSAERRQGEKSNGATSSEREPTRGNKAHQERKD